MKRKNMIHRLSALLLVILLLVATIGTLAYFTDRVKGDATVKTVVNGVDIEPEPDPDIDPDDPDKPGPDDQDDPYVDPTPDDPDDDLTNWWGYLNSVAEVNFNPGDKMSLGYILTNKGELAVDVRETFIVTSSKPLSATPEFRLFTSVTQDGAGAYSGTSLVTETKIDSTHYKYTVAPYVMNSTEETISGALGTEVKKAYFLVFDKSSSNAFQGATCTVDYLVEAKQHTDGGDADWVTAATGSVTIGGQTVNAVPAN